MSDRKHIQDVVPVMIHRIHKPEPPVFSAHHHVEHDRAPFHHFQKPKKARKQKNPRRRKIGLIILLGVVCIALVFMAITYVYAKAVVIITPKTEQTAVSGTYSAFKSGSAPAGVLPYEFIETSESASTTVLASQGPMVDRKAWGLVVLYNAYSTTPQKLVIGTRLASDKGLIYTTAETVTLPGIHKTPTAGDPYATSTGSVAVYVVAAEPGPQYNIAPTDLTGDFHIVAFEGTSKYATMYGRLKPNGSIGGGYSGYGEIVATSTLNQASASLTQTVTGTLTSDLKTLVPNGYVIYDGAYTIRLASTTVSETSSTTGSAVLTLRGWLSGIMFKASDLVKAVAPAQVAEFPPGDFVINDLGSLQFVPSDPTAFKSVLYNQNSTSSQISFTLSGSFGMIGTFPSDVLAQGLAGLSVPQSKDIFAQYSTIMSAHAIITPFWKHSFPDSPNKIIIVVQQ